MKIKRHFEPVGREIAMERVRNLIRHALFALLETARIRFLLTLSRNCPSRSVEMTTHFTKIPTDVYKQ